MLTKLIATLVVMLAVATAVPRERRQLFDGEFETSQVVTLLKNAAFVRTQAKCAMATEAEAAAICDRVGRLIRKNIPNAIRTLECPGNCTVKELKTIVLAYEVVTKDYPDLWAKLLNHYKVTPEQITAMEKWMVKTRALPDAPEKPKK